MVDRMRSRTSDTGRRKSPDPQHRKDPEAGGSRVEDTQEGAPSAPRPRGGLAGDQAAKPTQIPGKGWLQITKRAFKESSADQAPLLAAGVAFFSFLSLFPAMIAAVMVYGLVADPRTVEQQADALTQALPQDAASLITEQLRNIATTSDTGLGLGLVIALAGALWSASGGVNNLLSAVNIAYDEEETRSMLKRRGLALAFTFGAIVFAVVAIGLIAVTPVLLDAFISDGILRWLLEAARWVGLLAAVAVGLAVIYRFAPDRDAPQFQWVSTGAAVATVIWLVASLGFSLYVNNFGSYGKTYGSLAGVVVLMLWLWITCFIVLLGAEINSEAEHQTEKDTTRGDPEPFGQRDAVKADTMPESPEGETKKR